MYDDESTKKLVDNEAHVLYVKDHRGKLQYYSIPPESLIALLNKVYLNAYSDAFEQSDGQSGSNDFL